MSNWSSPSSKEGLKKERKNIRWKVMFFIFFACFPIQTQFSVFLKVIILWYNSWFHHCSQNNWIFLWFNYCKLNGIRTMNYFWLLLFNSYNALVKYLTLSFYRRFVKSSMLTTLRRKSTFESKKILERLSSFECLNP